MVRGFVLRYIVQDASIIVRDAITPSLGIWQEERKWMYRNSWTS